MSIALDGFGLLRQIGKHPNVFALVRLDVDKQARALVVKCLKARSAGPGLVRDIYKALGEEQFRLLVEGLKDADAKSIVTRLDQHHPDVKGGTAGWRRQHLNALADGSSEPLAPPATVETAAAKTKTEPSRLQSNVVDIFREAGKKNN
jgi:hypothetical protein